MKAGKHMKGKEIKTKKIPTSIRLDEELKLRIEEKVVLLKRIMLSSGSSEDSEALLSFQSIVHQALELWIRDTTITKGIVVGTTQKELLQKCVDLVTDSLQNGSSGFGGNWKNLLRELWPTVPGWKIRDAAQAMDALGSLVVNEHDATRSIDVPGQSKSPIENLSKGLGNVSRSKADSGRGVRKANRAS